MALCAVQLIMLGTGFSLVATVFALPVVAALAAMAPDRWFLREGGLGYFQAVLASGLIAGLTVVIAGTVADEMGMIYGVYNGGTGFAFVMTMISPLALIWILGGLLLSFFMRRTHKA